MIFINIGDLWFKRKKDLNYFDQSVTAHPEITKMKITKDMEFVIDRKSVV